MTDYTDLGIDWPDDVVNGYIQICNDVWGLDEGGPWPLRVGAHRGAVRLVAGWRRRTLRLGYSSLKLEEMGLAS